MKHFDNERQSAFRRFDLNLLRVLDILLEEKNVTHAASRMCVSQQAMSGALQRIREFLNDQVLVRVGREMQLTPLGRSLAQPVRELMSSIESTLSIEPSFDPRATKRTFRISMSECAASVIMPKVYALLAEKAPYVTCQVEFLGNFSLNRLSTNELDLCIPLDVWRLLASEEPGIEIRTLPLFNESFVCVVDNGHRPAGGTLTLEDYRRLPHGTVRLGRGMKTIIEHTWELEGFAANVIATVPSFSALISFVPGTPLVATVPARLAWKLAKSLPISLYPCPIAIPDAREVMVWHTRDDFDPGHQFIRRVIEDAAAEVEAEDISRASLPKRAVAAAP